MSTTDATDAGLLRRLASIIYDWLLVLALLFLATLPFIAAYGGEPVPADNLLYRAVLAIVVWLFFTIFWSQYGRTLGMQSWGMRIETVNGDRPGFWRTNLRFVGAVVSLLPFGAGFWWQVIDPQNRSWHDRLSGTRLIFYGKVSGKKVNAPD
jgi:uncharacterized RDD family membrane protein YckC